MKVELLKSQNIELSKLEVNKGQIEGLPKNPRLIKDAKFEKLKKSIEDNPEMLGMREVLVFPHGSKYVIIGGNMRFQACKELQFKTVPCKVLSKDTTAEQLRAITIKDNVGFGEHDWELLANEWDSVELEEWGLEVPNFETEETILEAEEDDYEEPDNLKVDVVLGDLIEFECTDGRVHRLICGDSTDSDTVAKLMDGEKADMVFTSPPYNGNTKAGQGDIFNKKKSIKLYDEGYSDNLDSDKYVDFTTEVLDNCFLFTDGFIFWNVSYNANSRFEYIKQIYNHIEFLIEQICWKKSSSIPFKGSLMRDWEPIYIFSTNGNTLGLNTVVSNHWEINNRNAQQENHKACFPIELPFKAIEMLDKSKIILEPFTGSGSTMVAAHQLKRKCYGMELDTKYCQVIIDRMQKLDSSIKVKINSKEYNYVKLKA